MFRRGAGAADVLMPEDRDVFPESGHTSSL